MMKEIIYHCTMGDEVDISDLLELLGSYYVSILWAFLWDGFYSVK